MRKRLLIFNEAGTLIRLTGPIVLAQLSQSAMGVVDTVMAGRYNAVDLAAVAVGTSIFLPLFLFVSGLMAAVTPLVAQGYGRQDHPAIRHAIRQGMKIGFLTGLLIMPVLWLAEPVMIWMEVSEEVIPIACRYLFAVSWSLPVTGLFFALRNGGDGLARPHLSMIAGLFCLLVNVGANYVLIYGKLGFPSLGGVGCGWATSFSMLVMLLVMAGLLVRIRIPAVRGLFRFGASEKKGESILSFLHLGFPIGITLFIECSVFALITLLVARMGAHVVAGHQITANFAGLVYMLPLGLATAMTVRVGYCIGRRRILRLRRAIFTGLGMALVLSSASCVLMFLFAPDIVAFYTSDPKVQSLSVMLLGLAALFQIPDALQVNCGGILRGFKDTRVVLVISIIAYWGVGLPMGYGLGTGWLSDRFLGPQGFWIGLIIALSASALLMGFRVRMQLRRAQKGRK
ncbi:MATE family efflux transporter [Desulfosarcina sp. OttesenSCG-928-A07]|nr:MATE family efflux transporter [Desulfosarcina sp. OttesenSCG-928-A07]